LLTNIMLLSYFALQITIEFYL